MNNNYEWDINTDIAICLFCGERLKKTTRHDLINEILVADCDSEACLAMRTLQQ